MSESIFERIAREIPEEEMKLVEKQHDISERIDKILISKQWSYRDLANAMGKRESYISRIMAGVANLTLKTIVNFEIALEEKILEVPKVLPNILENDLHYIVEEPAIHGQSLMVVSRSISISGSQVLLSSGSHVLIRPTPIKSELFEEGLDLETKDTLSPADYGYMASA